MRAPAGLDATIRNSGFRCEQSSYVPVPGPLSIYLVARYSLGR